MCKWNKWGNTRIDPCMRNLIDFLKLNDVKVLACCCGHEKYSMTIVCDWGGVIFEIMNYIEIPRKKKFYKKDKQGYYYIPEVLENEKENH